MRNLILPALLSLCLVGCENICPTFHDAFHDGFDKGKAEGFKEGFVSGRTREACLEANPSDDWSKVYCRGYMPEKGPWTARLMENPVTMTSEKTCFSLAKDESPTYISYIRCMHESREHE